MSDISQALLALIESLPANQKQALLQAVSRSAPASPSAPTKRAKVDTPLANYLRALPKDQREAFASACETTEIYLYQLASKKLPNPVLRLAHAIVTESRRIADRTGAPPLSYEDLLIGNPTGRDNTKPRSPRELKRASTARGDGPAGAR